MKSTDFRPVTRAKPCAICGKSDWCRRSDDGCHECHRSPAADPPGFKRLKTTASGFGLYRNDNGMLQSPRTTGSTNDKKPKTLYDTPAEAINAITRGKEFPQGKRQTSCSTYHDTVGAVHFKVVRFDFENGDKTFRPIHPVGGKWAVGDPPGKLPLYRLPEVLEAKQRGKTIYVVEGEGCADAVWSIGLPATTSAHGCTSAVNTDWTPLAGADVIVLPDNDPRGETYAEAVATLVSSLKPRAAVRIVRLPDLPQKGDVVDHIARLDSRDDADIARGIEALAQAAVPWTPIARVQRIAESTLEPPRPWKPFPVEVLPEPLRTFVPKAAAAIGVDPANIVLPLLASLAAAIGTTRRLFLKQAWSEPSVLWGAIVSDSGQLKSPAIDVGTEALREEQRVARDTHTERKQEHEKLTETYKRDLKCWQEQQRKSPDDDLSDEKPREPVEPKLERFTVDDITIEALGELLVHNPRGVLRIDDELSAWFGSFGVYNKAMAKDRSAYLKMHGARSLEIDRKTASVKYLYVPYAAVSIIGPIQPGSLRDALGRDNFQNGLAARLLFAMPPRRQKRWTENDLLPADKEGIRIIVRELLGLRHGETKTGEFFPIKIEFSAEGKRAWIEYYNRHGLRQFEETDADLGAAFSKLEGYAARFALIFHFVRWANNDETLVNENAVDEISVQAGVVVAEWFCHETERVYAVLKETVVQADHRHLIELIRNRGGEVSPSDLSRANRRYRPNDVARGVLDELAAAGHGSWVETPPTATGGRPSRIFKLHEGAPMPTLDNSDSEPGTGVS